MTKRRYFSAFINGFLYVFGLSDNPIKSVISVYQSKNDSDAISGDWEKVGTEIKKAFDVETKQGTEYRTTC